MAMAMTMGNLFVLYETEAIAEISLQVSSCLLARLSNARVTEIKGEKTLARKWTVSAFHVVSSRLFWITRVTAAPCYAISRLPFASFDPICFCTAAATSRGPFATDLFVLVAHTLDIRHLGMQPPSIRTPHRCDGSPQK